MRFRVVVLAACLCSSAGFGQVFEASISGGVSRFGGGRIGYAPGTTPDAQYTMQSGFRLAFRMTLNSWRFFGNEFGYAYSHTSMEIPPITTPILGGSTTTLAQNVRVPIHQGFYDFLVYATPEGTRIRPFGAGGVQFSGFFPPATSVYYGNQTTKYGFNYGGGLKIRLTSIGGIRLDARYYNMSKPFDFLIHNGRFIQQEYTVGLSFNL